MALDDVGPLAGFEAKLYIKLSSTWTEMIFAQNVSRPDSATAIEASCKGSPNKKYILGQADQSLEFGYLYIKGLTDTVFDALKAAKQARTHIEVAHADGAIATVGTKYVRDWYVVEDFSEDEQLDDVITFSIKLKPTLHFVSGALVERESVTVSS
jgi:hypothetical protein